MEQENASTQLAERLKQNELEALKHFRTTMKVYLSRKKASREASEKSFRAKENLLGFYDTTIKSVLRKLDDQRVKEFLHSVEFHHSGRALPLFSDSRTELEIERADRAVEVARELIENNLDEPGSAERFIALRDEIEKKEHARLERFSGLHDDEIDWAIHLIETSSAFHRNDYYRSVTEEARRLLSAAKTAEQNRRAALGKTELAELEMRIAAAEYEYHAARRRQESAGNPIGQERWIFYYGLRIDDWTQKSSK